ncbi:hypothetical protein [Halorubrum distributum]|uniref:hypothetical protein n=1 Tax=Halorubrum distributum TaxID=29283 RepID=UPI0012674D0B|nr:MULTISPECIES: hypothetical protein [Halorubrum distributum group]
MEVEDYLHEAGEVASKADTETKQSYRENVSRYSDKDYTYIPIPDSDQYYNVESGVLGTLRPEQIISGRTHLIEVLRRMEDLPFLLIDRCISTYYIRGVESGHILRYGGKGGPNEETDRQDARAVAEEHFDEDVDIFAPEEFKEQYPDEFEERISDPRYRIITLADLNKRPMKEMLYRLFAELSSSVSERISNQYPNSEELFDQVRPVVIGRWKKAKMKDINLHISEHMNMTDMKNVLLSSDIHLVEACGFESKEDIQTLDSLSDIRNSVMHANRSLVHDRSDIDDVLDAINEAERILSNMP